MNKSGYTNAPTGLGPLATCIKKVATGPEYSKDLSYQEAYDAMRFIFGGTADPVQVGVFFIALRMKRETEEENAGLFQAILDASEQVTLAAKEVVVIADPYDGFVRALPMGPFLAPVLAACDVATYSHGSGALAPKFGIGHRAVLQAAGLNVDHPVQTAAKQLDTEAIGWSYIDQRQFCPSLHKLSTLRERIVKRPSLSTIETLVHPIMGGAKTYLITGYVHKAYPPIYAQLARQAEYDRAIIIRGVEGGVVPSLQQSAKAFIHCAASETLQQVSVDPTHIGIQQTVRAVPLPMIEKSLEACQTARDEHRQQGILAATQATVESGLQALQGRCGPALDSLVYGASIVLCRLLQRGSQQECATVVKSAIASGKAYDHFKAALK